MVCGSSLATAALLETAVAVDGDGGGLDRYGYSVSLSGTMAAVGAPADSHVSGNPNAGAVYIEVRNAGVWQSALDDLQPTSAWPGSGVGSGALNSYFGLAVSLYGNTLAVGAPGNNGNRGWVCIFTSSAPASWTEQQCLTAPDAAPANYFGASLSLYGDTLAIGAPGRNGTGVYQGAVYIYTRSAGVWTWRQTITQTTRVNSNRFGSSIALVVDTASNARLVVGAPGAPNQSPNNVLGVPNPSIPTGRPGQVEVFAGVTTSGTWSNWTSEGMLTAPGVLNEDRFGYSVALTQLAPANPTIIVGAPLHDYAGATPATADAGAAYVFERTALGWVYKARLENADHHAGDQFGFSVALSGGHALIGMPTSTVGTDTATAGEVAIWSRGTGGSWSEQDQVDVSSGGSGHVPNTKDDFGWSVALAGNQAIIGAPGESATGTTVDVGSATAMTFPCALGVAYEPNLWAMLAAPCDLKTSNSLQTVLGDLVPGNYAHFLNSNFSGSDISGSSWAIYRRSPQQTANTSIQMSSLLDTLEPGTAYWFRSGSAPVGAGPIFATPSTSTAVPASLVFPATNPRCPTSNGCFVIDLQPVTGYQMVGNGLPFAVDWSSVVIDDGTTGYSPAQARAQSLLSNIFWIYSGSAYQSYDDNATPGLLPAMSSFFVYTYSTTSLKLLIPARPTVRNS